MTSTLCRAAAVLLLTAPAWADTAAHCPAVRDIRIQGALYSAPAPGGGQWQGIETARGPISHFQHALFFPDRDGGAYGHLAKCSYSLQRLGGVHLYLNPGKNSEPKVRLRDLVVWEQKQMPLGLSYHECHQADPTACTFLYRD